MSDVEFKNARKEAAMRMAHIFGYCTTNNCKLKYPQISGCDFGRSESNTNPRNIECEDKISDYEKYCEFCEKITGWTVFTLDRSKCMECGNE